MSPISFGAKFDLVEKLRRLESTKKGPKGSEPRDRSQANTQYSAGGDGLSEEGVARAAFEHQRLVRPPPPVVLCADRDRSRSVFYRLCQNSIDSPRHYALSAAPWIKDVCIIAFAFNLWGSDTRCLNEMQADPRVLDVGWTVFQTPTDENDLQAISTTHFVMEENKFLGNPGRTRKVRSVFLGIRGLSDPLILDTAGYNSIQATDGDLKTPQGLIHPFRGCQTLRSQVASRS